MSDYINTSLDLYGVLVSFLIVVGVIFGLLLLQSIVAKIFGWGGGDEWLNIGDMIENNRQVLSGERDPDTIVKSTVGWRRDPFNQQDGYHLSGHTPDGQPIYSRVVGRRGKK